MGADAVPARLAGLDPARELRLLRLVGLALRLPARRLDDRQPRAGRRDPSRVARSPRASRCSHSRSRSTSGCSATSSTRTSSSARSDNAARDVVDRARRAAGRDLLLHVHGDLVRRRHLPRRASSRVASHASRSSRRSSRTSSPARSSARASCCRSSSSRATRGESTSRARSSLIVIGLFLKVVIANHLATHIVDEVFAAPNRHSSLEVLVGVYGYAVQIFADFCGYTNIAIGDRAAARLRVPAELQLAVHRRLAAGLLAALAHDALALAARLPLHPARRQPQGRRC